MKDVNDELEKKKKLKKKKKHFYAYHNFIEKSSFINSNVVFIYFIYLLLLNHVM
jgi:beta-lactamase regulating signal transducer with metallopeptidase domain